MVRRIDLRGRCSCRPNATGKHDQICLGMYFLSLISFEKTCRYFAGLSKHRTLWVRFLRAFCRVHCIPWVTYDWENMNSEEIERSVCGVLRFERAAHGLYRCSLKESKSTLQPPPPISYNTPRSTLWPPPSINNMKLTPGGRYLVGINAEARGICCWDLMSVIEDYATPSLHPNRPLVASWSGSEVQEVARILTQCSPGDPNTMIVAAWTRVAEDAG